MKRISTSGKRMVKKLFFAILAITGGIFFSVPAESHANEKQTATIQADVFPMTEFSIPFRYQIITKGSDSSGKSWTLCYIKDGYNNPAKICFNGKGHKEFSVHKDLIPYQTNRITVCFDGENAIMYLNGEKIGEMPRSTPEENTHKMVIGKYMWGTDMDFPGKVTNVIYEKKLIVPEKFTPEGKRTELFSYSAASKDFPFTPVAGNWKKTAFGYGEFSDHVDVQALALSKQILPKNFVLNTDIITQDGIGVIALEFCRQENGDGYRLELNNSSSLTFLQIYKRKDGKLSLLEEKNSMNTPIKTSGNRMTPLQITLGRYNGMIHVQFNNRDIIQAFDDTFGEGKAGLVLHERKASFPRISAAEYSGYQVTIPVKAKPDQELALGTSTLRTVFFRDEKIPLNLTLINRSAETFQAEKITVSFAGKEYMFDPAAVPGMKNLEKTLTLDGTDLRDGEYTVTARSGNLKQEFKLSLVSRPPKDLYRFYDWGDAAQESLNKYHFNGLMVTFSPKDDFRKYREMLAKKNDYAMKHRMSLGIHWQMQTAVPPGGANLCILRKDGSRGPVLYPHNEKVREYLRNGITDLMKEIRNYPAFNRIVLDSEIESVQEMDYSEQSIQMAKEALGFEPPMSNSTKMEIDGYAGVRVSVPDAVKKAVPAVFPNDNQHYRFMSYFWNQGTGDNLIREEAAEIIRKYVPGMMVYHEPYRDVPLASRMQGMDFGGTWYYCFPDGSESFMATESLLSLSRAMGKPEGFQIDPSLWLYQYEIGPSKNRQAGVHPANLYRSALQMAFAAKPTVIELYSISYILPETKVEFRQDHLLGELSSYSANVVKPLWSATRKLDREPRKTAILISFGSQIFDREHWGGWGKQAQNAVLASLWRANIPAAVVTEENIRMGELSRYDQLFLHKTTRLPQDIFDAVKAFAERGGTVVAEPGSPWKELIPGTVEFAVDTNMIARSSYYSINRGGFTADKVYDEQQATAEKMRKQFRKDGSTIADTNSRELFVQTLKNKDCAYVFLQNDKRTFGDFFGKKYKSVYDQGLPLQAEVTLNHKGAVYDFTAKKLLAADNGKLLLDFKPVEQKILILYPTAVSSLKFGNIPEFQPGKPADFQIAVLDGKGKRIAGIQPVRAVLTAPDGTVKEEFLSADDGLAVFSWIPGKNEPSGSWKLEAEELASGIKTSVTFKR